MTTTLLTLEALANAFLTCKEIEGRSPTTVSWYRDILARFCRYVDETLPGTTVADVGLAEARAFIHYLQTGTERWQYHPAVKTRGSLGPNTIRGYVRTIKVFFNWLADESYIETSPMRRLRQPRAPRKIIQTFSREQVTAMVSSMNLEWPTGYRSYLIVLLFLDTGLRLSEAAGLQMSDIDLSNSKLRVTGKGAKERVVPFGKQTCLALYRYLQHFRYRPLSEYENFLFTTISGTPLRPAAIQTMVRRLKSLAGITDVRCSPHTFRHTFAKSYLLNGGDVFSLQRILGHTSLEMVRLYVNLVDSDVSDLYREHSPIDHLMASSRAQLTEERLTSLVSSLPAPSRRFGRVQP